MNHRNRSPTKIAGIVLAVAVFMLAFYFIMALPADTHLPARIIPNAYRRAKPFIIVPMIDRFFLDSPQAPRIIKR